MIQKVSTMTDNNWGERFGNKGLSALAGFMSTYNMATQTFVFSTADPRTTGTAACFINGVYIPSLTVENNSDWSGTTAATSVEGDAKGVYVPNLHSCYFAVFADADGRLRVDQAGDILLDTACLTAGVKIPWFDPSEWCCIAIFLINSTGWTAGDTDVGEMETIYQVTGPVLPHPSNLSI